MTLLLKDWQVKQLKLIGTLIRNDWSGQRFDGRDIRNWIDDTLEGKNKLKSLREYLDD